MLLRCPGLLNIDFLTFFQIPFHIEQNKWWEIVLNISPLKKQYNPFSGNELWAHCGHNVSNSHHTYDNNVIDDNIYHDIKNNCNIEFSDQTEDRGGYPWRSCLQEGQLPHFLYWPL